MHVVNDDMVSNFSCCIALWKRENSALVLQIHDTIHKVKAAYPHQQSFFCIATCKHCSCVHVSSCLKKMWDVVLAIPLL